MTRYLSGRSKRRPQSQLRDDRYRYLSVDQAEPNFGDPTLFSIEANLPPGNQYQIISVIDRPGERYWIPRGGGLIPGSITVFDEDVIIPNNYGISSITQLNFKGDAIRAEGYLNSDGSPGVGVTITVFAPGSQGQFIINDSNEFTGVSSIFYDVSTNYIGIGTNIPSKILDVNGDIKLRGTIYDWDNQPGVTGDLIVKNNDGGLNWSNPNSVITGAGGQVGQIQFHANTGLVDGAEVFYYDDLNDRVGIGSTQPKYLLDVLGISSFRGTTYIDNLSVTNQATLNKLTANDETIFKSSVDVEIGASLNDVRIGISGNNEIDTSAGNLILDSSGGKVIVDDDLVVSGITSVGFITTRDAYVSGILTATNLDFFNTLIQYITVTGIATINNSIINQLNVTGIATINELDVLNYLDVIGNANFQQQLNANNLSAYGITTLGNIKLSGNTISASAGNLVLDSIGGNVLSQELIRFTNTTESTNSDTGSVVISGGLGVEKNLNIAGNTNLRGSTTLASNGGITTTGGDLYVGGNLYVGAFIGNAETATRADYATNAGISTNLKGGSSGSLLYQTAPNTTAFLAEPNVDGRVLTYNNTTNAPQWSDLANLPGAGYTLESIDSGNNVILRLSDGSTNDDVTITAGSNITINPVSASGFTISAASLDDLGGISGIEIKDSGTSQGTNVTKLDFVDDISAIVSGDTATISVTVPTDISDLTDITEVIKNTFNDNITNDATTINNITEVVSNYNITVSQTGYSGTNPITVNKPDSTTTRINIPSSSNAYGRRFISQLAPTSSDGNDGDIWYQIN